MFAMLHLYGQDFLIACDLLVSDHLLEQESLQGEVGPLALPARGVARAQFHLFVEIEESYHTNKLNTVIGGEAGEAEVNLQRRRR